MQKIIIKLMSVLLSLVLLSACTIQMGNNDDGNNTTSNITESTTEDEISTNQPNNTTTEPVADPIVSIRDMSTQKVVWGPGNITNHEQPTDPLSLQNTFKDLDAHWLLKDKKSVALTFDEGYENGFTPSILDTLKEKNVKAIFFVTYDFARDNPKLIKRMIDEGHIVGNHSYHHYSMDELNEASAREEVAFLHDYIKKSYNYTMSYFRFPKGEFSHQSLGILKDMGYKSIFWSFAYADWDVNEQMNSAEALQKICESSHDGAIILLHAVSETNAKILPSVIDDYRQQGYKFTTDIA